MHPRRLYSRNISVSHYSLRKRRGRRTAFRATSEGAVGVSSSALQVQQCRVQRECWSCSSFLLLPFSLLDPAPFLSVWSYSEGFYPSFVFLYICFNVETTIDIVSMSILNRHLVKEEETKMTFGQVPSLVLMGSIIFSAIDVFKCKYKYKRKG